MCAHSRVLQCLCLFLCREGSNGLLDMLMLAYDFALSTVTRCQGLQQQRVVKKTKITVHKRSHLVIEHPLNRLQVGRIRRQTQIVYPVGL